jgi:t-SNARE complex subunit (syntaxin)
LNLKDEPETRIKEMSYKAIKNKFAEVLKEAQNVQIDYKTSVKSKMARQVKLVDNTLTPDQVEEICNDPQVMKLAFYLYHRVLKN